MLENARMGGKSKKAGALLLTVLLLGALGGCRLLEVLSIVAPDSVTTGKVAVLTLNVLASSQGSGPGGTVGIVLQIPAGTKVLRAYYEHGSGHPKGDASPDPAITASYIAEPGYDLYGGTAYGSNTGNYTVKVWLAIPGGVSPGTYNIKAATGELIDSSWTPQYPKDGMGDSILDFAAISGNYTSNPMTISEGPIDTTPPVNISAVITRDMDKFMIDIGAYDEAGQGDIAKYRVYISKSPFTTIANALLLDSSSNPRVNCIDRLCSFFWGDIGGGIYYIELPPGWASPLLIEGLMYNTPYYFAVTALDVSGNESIPTVTALTIEAGSISGRVTTPGGAGIEEVWVEIFDTDTRWLTSVLTDSDGNYLAKGVPTGSYKIHFYGAHLGYVNEWFRDRTDFYNADVIHVKTIETTAGIDAVLTEGGTISGTVRDDVGVAIGGAVVSIYGSDPYTPLLQSSSGPDGSYAVTGVPTGAYKIMFAGSPLGYVDEWYNDKTDFYFADPVTVDAPLSTTGVDAVLLRTGSISGRVTDSQMAPLQGVQVMLCTTEMCGVAYTLTDAAGFYGVRDLLPGSYRVSFSISGYLEEWYNDKADFFSADTIIVESGSDLSGIDAVLDRGGGISGRVTDQSGIGIQDAYVQVFDMNYGFVGSVSTDSNGFYTIYGFPTGAYKVAFYAGGYTPEWYIDKAGFETADPVTVTSPVTTSGVDAELTLNGWMSGRVTSKGVGVGDIIVKVFDTNNNLIIWSTTSPGGDYAANIPGGNFKVKFEGCKSGYQSEWYDDRENFFTADLVTLSTPGETLWVDASLSEFPGIFSDILPGSWAEPYVRAIYCEKITLGYGDGTFRPSVPATRGMIASFIVRAVEGEPPANYCNSGSPFSDVPITDPFCNYIKRLHELNITTGYGDGTFRPDDSVTRAQMAAFIVRAVEGEPADGYCGGVSPFSDIATSDGFCKYIKRLSELGITTGYADGTFRPDGLLTRALAAAFLARAFLGMP